MNNYINFDLNRYDLPETESLPPGEYEVEIASCEMRPTSKAIKFHTNECALHLKLRVIKGKVGRIIWDSLNIVNENEAAQTIGRSRLKGIAHLTGRLDLLMETTDTSCLVGGIIGIVVVKDVRSTDKDRTRVNYYKAADKVKESVQSSTPDFDLSIENNSNRLPDMDDFL